MSNKKNVIVRFDGGLGNQLFIYSFCLFLKKLGYNATFDLTSYLIAKEHGGFLLDYMFSDLRSFPSLYVSIDDVISDSYHYFMVFRGWITQYYINKIKYRKNRYYIEEPKIEKIVTTIQNEKKDCIYLSGFWQNNEIVEQILDEIRIQTCKIDEISLPEQKKKEYELITKCNNAVSVHIRRGDYLKDQEQYGSICTEEYYFSSMKYFRDNSETDAAPFFFVFSDDYEYCKTLYSEYGDTLLINPAEGKQSYIDLLLMSLCKSHIIANSTFSWWGAMLSREKGITIMPYRWSNNSENYLKIKDSISIDSKGMIR